MYIVEILYREGHRRLFVTDSIEYAMEYCRRFNHILKKWKNHYKQFEDEDHLWLEEEFVATHGERYYDLKDIIAADYFEINHRKETHYAKKLKAKP